MTAEALDLRYGPPLLRRLLAGRGLWPAVPALIHLVVFLVLPLGTLLLFGFVTIERGRVIGDSLTFEPLLRTLQDGLFWRLTWRSFWVATASSLFTLLLAYPVAYVFSEVRGLWRSLIMIAVVSPLLTSALVRTYAWLVVLGGRRGIVNQALLGVGLIDQPLHLLYSDFAVLVGMTQIHMPFMVLPLIAALAERNRSLEEASLNLGASRVETFFRVVVPISTPGIVAGLALVFAISYTNFIVPQLLGGGNYSTLAVQDYEQTIVVLDWTRGAVLATLLLSSCFGFVLLIVAAGNRFSRWMDEQ